MKKATKSGVVIFLNHPHGRLEIPLEDWIRDGPGPRTSLRPVLVREAESGDVLPMNTIPFRYRNSAFSKLLIRLGLIRDPWA